MTPLTNDERVRAATGQFESNKQARDIYDRLIKETKAEIESLKGQRTEEARTRTEQLKDTVKYVETAKGNLGYLKAAGGGLLAGASDILAFPVDIAFQLTGRRAPSEIAREQVATEGILGLGNVPIIGGLFTLPSRATTEEVQPVFGGARGLVQVPLRTPAGTAIQSLLYGGAGAADESGVATTTLAVGQLGQSLFQLGKLGLSTKQQRDLIKNLPDTQKTSLQEFVLKGQTGSDPQVAALIQRLKANPETAELVNALEEGAKQKTFSGMAPQAQPGEIANPIYKAIKQKLGTLQYNITGQPIQDKFKRAKDVLGGSASVSIPETIKRMDDLIAEFNNIGNDSARAAVRSLERSKASLMTEVGGQAVPLTTVEKLQGNLSSFGKGAGEENIFKDVARSDQERIAAVVFGGLKTDLAIGTKSPNVDVRKASLYLEQARGGVEKGYGEFNKFIAQGLPDKLKNVDLNQLDDVKITDVFKGLTTAQRNKILPILESQAPEAVDRLRSRYYNDFIGGATKQLPDGTYGTDFKQIVDKYNKLDEADRDLLSFSLGTNSKEFDERMKDATAFFRYNMKIGGAPQAGQLIPGQTERAGQGLVGSIFGYQAAKGADVAMQLVNNMSTSLKDTDVLKILLTQQGKDFLRNAKLSPAGVKTLEGLETLRLADIPLPSTAINLKRGFEQLTTTTPPPAEDLVMPEQQFGAIPTEEETAPQQGGFSAVPLD
jgi:hypothetical protein